MSSVHHDLYTATVAAERRRLVQDADRRANWKRWGPYLAERQWGTVREDYSPDGDCWNYFPHEQARSRAYRWGEDGLLGLCDRECRLCFSLALWNGRDPILKERLFGLTGPEGTCGEDVKEQYFYLDSTPTHTYMRGLYKYPQAEFPYARLVDEARRRTRAEGEFELADTGVFEGDRYFDVQVEYAKASPDDVLIRVVVRNRGPERAELHVLPTLWFRNTWSWGCRHDATTHKPSLRAIDATSVLASHESLGEMVWSIDAAPGKGASGGRGAAAGAGTGVGAGRGELLFTENDTNTALLFGAPNAQPYVKDAFHRAIVGGEAGAVNPARVGTKAAAYFRLSLAGGESATLRLRLTRKSEAAREPFGAGFDQVMAQRLREADEFYDGAMPESMPAERKVVARQAYAGLLWSKQFYHYVVEDWLKGDPDQPPPPVQRRRGRNADWPHLFNRDVISMPDKWEYPWYAAWDLAFHTIALGQIDPAFAKDQLLLFLREWYMHPNGQLPAYEFALGDVNPPVHAWAVWRVYKITAPAGQRDRLFLERAFQKLLLNFTWWVNRKDPDGQNVFGGGFLGLDNIGVFDRSRPLPTGGQLQQADGTAWMAFYCGTMLSMALELALHNPAYEDIASKFFEHFIHIADAINTLGGNGLWDERDGFYYDQLRIDHENIPLRVRSLVGILPIMAVETIPQSTIDALPGFKKRTAWFLANRKDLAAYTSHMVRDDRADLKNYLLAIPTRQRLASVLRYVLDEGEFLSPFGVRSLSRFHLDSPYVFKHGQDEYRVDYTPGESVTALFGGNSNWRGPIWFPLNYLLVESLERWHRFFGNSFRIECPTGSGTMMNLAEVADHLRDRLAAIFLPGPDGRRACLGGDALLDRPTRSSEDPLLLFHEYFHGDTGRGLGASHQTGWTALIAPLLADRFWLLDKQLKK
jgi:hypothetical protein